MECENKISVVVVDDNKMQQKPKIAWADVINSYEPASTGLNSLATCASS